ncbi:MAG: serine/threonine protein kinase, partial [Hamadaea sp.]|nr:serine/threonine protein kinase [Hamadaea sp.]
MARLHHPNIVEVYDYGEVGDAGGTRPYVVMELVEGRSLAELLSAGALPWQVAVLVCAQVAAALTAAHEQGVVHRDVTPPNVMVTAAGVKLLDFGICAVTGEADLGDGDEIVGTPAYLAPERLEHGLVNPATDVYALGLLLYRALAGHAPWTAASPLEAVRAHREVDPAPLPGIDGLPAEITDLCLRCLAREPDDRPNAAQAALVLAQAAGVPVAPAAATAAKLVTPSAVPAVLPVGRAFASAVASAGAAVSDQTRVLDKPGAWQRRIAVAVVAALLIGGMAA